MPAANVRLALFGGYDPVAQEKLACPVFGSHQLISTKFRDWRKDFICGWM